MSLLSPHIGWPRVAVAAPFALASIVGLLAANYPPIWALFVSVSITMSRCLWLPHFGR